MTVNNIDTMNTQEPIKCCLQIRFGDHVQESYETGSRNCRSRGRQLRDAGFRVFTSPMGFQVTRVGSVKLTMLTAYGDLEKLPEVTIERL